MDGLLGNQSALSLLGMSPENIARSRDQAQSDMYFALAGSLLGGGPTGLSIAKGLQAGQQAYRNAMKEQQAEQMQLLQLQEFKRKKEEEEAAKQRQLLIDAAIARAYVPGQAAVEAPTPTGPISGAAFGEVSTPAVASKLDLQSITPALMTSREGRAALAELAKTQEIMQPKMQTLKEGEKLGYLQDGKFVEVAGLPKQKALKEVDLGNVVVMLDDQGKEVMRFAKGRAPEGPVSLQTVETEQGIATFNPKTGALTPVMQGGKPVMGKGAGQLTEGQSLATGFGMRMAESNKIIEGLAQDKTTRGALIEKTPFVGQTLGRVLPSALGGTSAEQQQFNQAKENFITAVLRKESGAAIGQDEFEREDRKYFPQINDDQKTIDQKAKARQLAIKAMKLSAGPGAKYIETGVTSSGW